MPQARQMIMRACVFGLLVHASACSSSDNPTGSELPMRRLVVIDDGDISNNGVPFCCTTDQRYQQIYSATAFDGGGTILSVSFPSWDAVIPLATADYLLRLETTPIPVMELSHDLNDNLGTGAVTAFQQRIEGYVPTSDTVTFELDTPFHYDPNAGNLLLDVVIANAVDDNRTSGKTFEAIRNSSVTSRRPAYGGAGDGYGLVTAFLVERE